MASEIVWVHEDCLSPENPAIVACPGAPALFVFDPDVVEQHNLSMKRILFVYECLLELQVTIARGGELDTLRQFAREHGAKRVVTTETHSARRLGILAALSQEFEVRIVLGEPFLKDPGELDLRRFSRYWNKARKQAFGGFDAGE